MDVSFYLIKNKYLRIVFSSFMLFSAIYISSQQKISISGFVKDSKSGERLIGANIFNKTKNIHAVTDYNGFFSVMLNCPQRLEVSYIGYKKQVVDCKFSKDTILNILLTPTTNLSEITINAKRINHSNVSSINIDELSKIPAIGGKPDISKGLQLLPGISMQNEGSSLLLVRGGDPGQNLYLFDDIPLIYVNHLGGFSSVFNPDIINHIDVYKGGFPANYGGKLSSVVDITQKTGNNSQRKGQCSIGTMDISFLLEGPLKLKNSSFIIAGRKTVIDPLMIFASKLSDGNDYILSYGYHDINAKFSWNPNIRNKFSLNFYQGDDYLNYWGGTKKAASQEKYHFANVWGNWLASMHWKTILASKIFVSNSISYTRYRLKDKMKYKLSGDEFSQKYLSSVQDLSLCSRWKTQVFSFWYIDFGLQSSLYFHLPNKTWTSSGTNMDSNQIKSSETALFVGNKILIMKNMEIYTGFRNTYYFADGLNKIFIDPRLSFSLNISNNHRISASYMRVRQFSHLLFTAGKIMNNEVWIPADNNIFPAYSEQISLGWQAKFAKSNYSFEANAYYKKMQGLATYKEGFYSLKGDKNWQSKIETGGEGVAKGIELFFKKNIGKWTGFVSYTLSNTMRKYQQINNGQEFLFDFDRLHSFSLNLNFKISKKFDFNLVWIYQTGLPYTPAIGKQYTTSTENGKLFYYETLIYGERNSGRFKDYHRLDLGLSYTTLNKSKRKAVWNFSVYNAYNRHNPYYYYYATDASGEIFYPEPGQEQKPLALYQQSFFPIIPSISYKVYFGHGKKEKKKQPENKLKNWLYYKEK